MLGTVLLVEVLAVHAVGIALHRQRPAMQMRQQDRSDAYEVVDDLPLGEAGLGIKHLVKVRQLQVPALDVNHDVFVLGHRFPAVGMMQSESGSLQIPTQAREAWSLP